MSIDARTMVITTISQEDVYYSEYKKINAEASTASHAVYTDVTFSFSQAIYTERKSTTLYSIHIKEQDTTYPGKSTRQSAHCQANIRFPVVLNEFFIHFKRIFVHLA